MRIPAICVFLLLLCAALASAAGPVTGHVVDPDGRAVPGTRVVVTDANGVAAETATDPSGAFAIASLPAGTYDLRVVAQGFSADPRTITVGAAADAPGIDVTITLRISAVSESVVVSASGVDLPRSQTAETVTVITGADLEARQIETVSDALRLVPGLTVTRSGGRGAITSLFPRGGNSNYTLVLVDGIQANSFGGAYDFANLSVANIDHIEIVRGPESALYGSDAISAVVEIVTKRGGPPRAGGIVEAGGFGTSHELVDASGAAGAWTFGGGAEHLQSDGYTGIAPATGEHVSNDDYHLNHATGSLGWQKPNGGPEFDVTGNITRDERGFPGPYGSNPIGAYTAVDRISRGIDHTEQVGGRFLNSWSPRVRQRIDVSYFHIGSDFTSPFGASNSASNRADGRIQEDISLTSALAVSGGFEFLHEKATSTFITAASSTIPIDRSIAGLFGELRYIASDRVTLTGGVRVDHITRDAVPADPGGFPPRPTFPSQSINSANPKGTVTYLLTNPADSRTSTRLRASAGTGIRAPDAFEIAFTDNPNLQPERSQGVDVGVEQQFAGGAYVFSATGFFERYNDLIVAVGKALANASQYQTDNISNARARGVELSGGARLTAAFTVRATYTFLDTEILSVDGLARIAPPPFNVGDPLIRRPRHQGAIDLLYAQGRFTAFGEVIGRGQILDVEPTYGAFGGLFPSPGYSVVNAGAGFDVVKGVQIFGRVLNVANTSYEETLGYPALGRTAMAGVRLAAGR